MAERLRGRAGMAQRQRRLDRTNGLCEMCLAEGRTKAATIVDHKLALALGGSDDDENTQNLCDDHNAIKTAAEDASHAGAANHPTWLNRSAIPLTIISGPPCSGKTTYIGEHANANDIIIDFDGIATKLQPGYRHWSGMMQPDLMNKAIRVRNAMLGSLERQRSGRAWFIVSAPTKAERDWWRGKLGGELVLLHPGADECKRRALARGTPAAIKGIDTWGRAAAARWQAPEEKRAKASIGVDGWPT